MKPLILISNDDGYHAKGMHSLINFIRDFGDIIVCAPESVRSGFSRAFSATTPLTLKEREIKGISPDGKDGEGTCKVYSCSGTPVDCLKMAYNRLCPRKPDLVIGGLNHGGNESTNSHYSGSGYTRGHIIASADRWNSLEANRQTFLYSNMQPQLYSFNGGIWANLEMKVRSWNNDAFRDTLYVCKGGTIDRDDQILEYARKGTVLQLLVPKYFFMAILCKNRSTINGGYKAIGFWMEHRSFYEDDQNLSPYIVSIDELESLTGIDFFCNLPDHIENPVESQVIRNAWGFQ